MRVIAAVFARGGSKGVPRKNLRVIAGKSLVELAIQSALDCPRVERVILSTDSEEIAIVGRAVGAEVPWLRPARLAADGARELDAWRHLLEWLVDQGDEPDLVLVVPCTAPLREPEDLERCIEAATPTDIDLALTASPAQSNPWFNMVTIDERGRADLLIKPDTALFRRQDAPRVFDVGTVAFAAKPAFIRRAQSLYDGTVAAVEIPAERNVDIDTEADLAAADFLVRRRMARQRAERPTSPAHRDLAELSRLDGRVAVVTGAAGHIGRVVADGMAEQGATLVLVDLAQARCDEVAREITYRHGTPVLAIGADIAVDEVTRDVAARAQGEFGRIDILCHLATLVNSAPLENWTSPFDEQDPDLWRQALELNLTSVFVLTQACTAALRASGNGSVITFGSTYGLVGPDWRIYHETDMGNAAAYAASKGGVIQLTRWLSTTLAPDIRVNCLTPGGVFRDQPEPFRLAYEQRTPMGRMASEEDFKGATAFLASDLSRYVTGHNLIVDGGWTAW